ncbi:phosphatase PAP2 family protein [Streptomyces luteireticuli]|uniref:Phosphatase PAP2 family protein n=1 Tax=Streptomyces luteireticuli TaxID=173858 RepID=A0ABP3J0T8_9ACTN
MTAPLTVLAYDGSGIDGSVYTDVVGLARRSPGWLDSLVTAWSAYGLALFAVLMAVAWWRARAQGPRAAVPALAAPLIVVAAFALDDLLKAVVREDRPCRTLHTVTLEACPAPGDWSFPSNHATLAAATAVAVWFVSRRLGLLTAVAALAMAASRVWVGVHYPHDVAAGVAVGALTAAVLAVLVRRCSDAVARRLTATRLRPLLTSS